MGEKKIPRRRFIKSVAAGVAASATFGPVYAQTQKRLVWRMATSWPESLDTIYGGALTVAQRVRDLTGGRFVIEVYPAGKLGKALDVLDLVSKGKVEAGHTASYYYTNKHPAFAFGTALPFGLTARQQDAWLGAAGGNELLNRELYSQFRVIGFPAGNTSLQMGGWFRRPVDSVADLRGLKMRIPGLGGVVLKRLGVNVKVVGAAEIAEALKQGLIDAAEWVGPYDDEKLGLYRYASYYYYPGWWEPGTTLHLFVNRDAWSRLPKAWREVIVSAARDANARVLQSYDNKNPLALERLLSYGVRLRPFTPEVLRYAEREANALYRELSAKDALYRKVFEHWDRARTRLFRWFGVNERYYGDWVFPNA